MRRAHRLRLWDYVSDHRYFVAYSWVARGLTLTDLTQTLGVNQTTAIRLGACRAPQSGEDLDEWAADVAQYLRLDPGRVREVARRLTAGG